MGLEYIKETECLLPEMVESFKYHGDFYRMAYLTYEIIGDYKMALSYAQSGYEYYRRLPFSHVYAESSQLIRMARCYLYLGELPQGKSALEIAILSYREGSMNWFVCGYQRVMIDIHLKEYNRAYAFHNNMISQRSFKSQNDEVRSFNLLVGGYLEFLKRVGYIDGDVNTRCLLYTSPSPRDRTRSRMPSSA